MARKYLELDDDLARQLDIAAAQRNRKRNSLTKSAIRTYIALLDDQGNLPKKVVVTDQSGRRREIVIS